MKPEGIIYRIENSDIQDFLDKLASKKFRLEEPRRINIIDADENLRVGYFDFKPGHTMHSLIVFENNRLEEFMKDYTPLSLYKPLY